jgi:hypothetical protein
MREMFLGTLGVDGVGGAWMGILIGFGRLCIGPLGDDGIETIDGGFPENACIIDAAIACNLDVLFADSAYKTIKTAKSSVKRSAYEIIHRS